MLTDFWYPEFSQFCLRSNYLGAQLQKAHCKEVCLLVRKTWHLPFDWKVQVWTETPQTSTKFIGLPSPLCPAQSDPSISKFCKQAQQIHDLGLDAPPRSNESRSKLYVMIPWRCGSVQGTKASFPAKKLLSHLFRFHPNTVILSDRYQSHNPLLFGLFSQKELGGTGLYVALNLACSLLGARNSLLSPVGTSDPVWPWLPSWQWDSERRKAHQHIKWCFASL